LAEFVRRFPLPDQAEIVVVYRLAIQRVFLVAIAFSGVAWLLCFFVKDIVLRVDLVTEYGLKEEGRSRMKTRGNPNKKRTTLRIRPEQKRKVVT
jgi:hypothetical protein